MNQPVDSFEVVVLVIGFMNPITLDLASWGFSAVSWVRLAAWIHGGWHF